MSANFQKPSIGQPGHQSFRSGYGRGYDHNFLITSVNESGKTIEISLFNEPESTHVLIWRNGSWKEKGKSKDRCTSWHVGSHSNWKDEDIPF